MHTAAGPAQPAMDVVPFRRLYDIRAVLSDPLPATDNDKCVVDVEGRWVVASTDALYAPEACIDYPVCLQEGDHTPHVVFLFRKPQADAAVDRALACALRMVGSGRVDALHVDVMFFYNGDMSQMGGKSDRVIAYGCFVSEAYGTHVYALRDLYLDHTAYAVPVSKAEMLHIFMVNSHMLQRRIPYNTVDLPLVSLGGRTSMVSDLASVHDASALFCSQAAVLLARAAASASPKCALAPVARLNSRCTSPCELMRVLAGGEVAGARRVDVRSLFSDTLVHDDDADGGA
jgi:hypothetical protein